MKMCDYVEFREKVREHILAKLDSYEGYLCDFHNYAFNTDYYECYTDRAEQQLYDLGIFEVIGYIVEYEKDNFGEVNTDFSNPCNVLNMFWYIIGDEEIINAFADCDVWQEKWNEIPDAMDIEKIKACFEYYIEEQK